MSLCLIPLKDGTFIPATREDIDALIQAGMLEVVESDGEGRPQKLRVTQAAYDFVDNEKKAGPIEPPSVVASMPFGPPHPASTAGNPMPRKPPRA